MDPVPSAYSHRCQICNKEYKRLEHLKRHVNSHTHQLPHSCSACGRKFARSDALTRHLKTCTAHHGGIDKSSRRRVCTPCAQSKKACDLGFPCQSCESKGLACSYSIPKYARDDIAEHDIPGLGSSADLSQVVRCIPPGLAGLNDRIESQDLMNDFFEFTSSSWDDFLNLLSPSIEITDASTTYNLNFLDNFTKQNGLINSFDCGDLKMRQDALVSAMAHAELVVASSPTVSDEAQTPSTIASVCEEIVSLIEEVAIIKPRNSAVDVVWSDQMRKACSQFFNPLRLLQNIQLYWLVWHPNVNIIHHATFNITSSKVVLIAAMSVIGALLSPIEEDRGRAQIWLNAVEEIVFIDHDLCDEYDVSFDQDPPLARIQAMQAAYIVCLYQNWEGTDQAKRRIRRHRFNTLVSATRDIGIHKARHETTDPVSDSMWLRFVCQEQLIRVIIWVFLLDTAFVIFNNLPPRMVITEMNMDLASCEAVFQAESAGSWVHLTQQIRAAPNIHQSFSLYQAAEVICVGEVNEVTSDRLADLGPLNLFAVTSSLHSMLFQYQHSFNTEKQLLPLRNALKNWRNIWTKYLREKSHSLHHDPLGVAVLTPGNMWKRTGFMRHAAEYWLLANLLLERICRTQRGPAGEEEAVPESTGAPAVKLEQTMHPLLKKYDETSMQQVNDLIADFQQTSIS